MTLWNIIPGRAWDFVRCSLQLEQPQCELARAIPTPAKMGSDAKDSSPDVRSRQSVALPNARSVVGSRPQVPGLFLAEFVSCAGRKGAHRRGPGAELPEIMPRTVQGPPRIYGLQVVSVAICLMLNRKKHLGDRRRGSGTVRMRPRFWLVPPLSLEQRALSQEPLSSQSESTTSAEASNPRRPHSKEAMRRQRPTRHFEKLDGSRAEQQTVSDAPSCLVVAMGQAT